MESINIQEIDKKWQSFWDKNNTFKYNTKNSLINPSFFVIADMSFNWNQFIT